MCQSLYQRQARLVKGKGHGTIQSMLDDNVYSGEKKKRWSYNRGVMLGASSVDDRQKSTSVKD